MYIIAEYEIADATALHNNVESGAVQLLSGLKIHQLVPNSKGTKAVCLWEAVSEEEIQLFVQKSAEMGRIGKL